MNTCPYLYHWHQKRSFIMHESKMNTRTHVIMGYIELYSFFKVHYLILPSVVDTSGNIGGASAEGTSLLGWSGGMLPQEIWNLEYCFLFVFKQCYFVLLCWLFVVVIVLLFLKMKTSLCFHFSKWKLPFFKMKLLGGGNHPPHPPSVHHWLPYIWSFNW